MRPSLLFPYFLLRLLRQSRSVRAVVGVPGRCVLCAWYNAFVQVKQTKTTLPISGGRERFQRDGGKETSEPKK